MKTDIIKGLKYHLTWIVSVVLLVVIVVLSEDYFGVIVGYIIRSIILVTLSGWAIYEVYRCMVRKGDWYYVKFNKFGSK